MAGVSDAAGAIAFGKRITLSMVKPRSQVQIARERLQRHELSRLKEKGLYSGDLRKRPTGYSKGLLRKFADVLSGDASVVTVDTKTARQYKEHGFRVAGKTQTTDKFGFPVGARRVIVDKPQKADRVFFNKTRKRIERIQVRNGQKSKVFLEPGIPERLPTPARNKRVYYAMPFGQGKNQYLVRRDSWEEMVAFMTPYETKDKNPYLDWREYVMIEEMDEDELDEDEIDFG